MALIFPGVSLCPLCERVIREGDECIGMSDGLPFWGLSRYADTAMHRACFEHWPLAELIPASYDDDHA